MDLILKLATSALEDGSVFLSVLHALAILPYLLLLSSPGWCSPPPVVCASPV